LGQYGLNIVGKVLELLEGKGARISSAARHHIVGYILGIGHGLSARGGITFVVEQEVIEIFWGLLCNGRQYSEIHQQVTLRIKHDDFFIWPC
jgi:hypothetical protein